MVYVIPLSCFFISLIVGMVAMHRRHGWIVPVVAGLAAALMVWAIWQGRQQQGWDAIGHVIVAMLMAAPVMFGALAGGAIGWWRRGGNGCR